VYPTSRSSLVRVAAATAFLVGGALAPSRVVAQGAEARSIEGLSARVAPATPGVRGVAAAAVRGARPTERASDLGPPAPDAREPLPIALELAVATHFPLSLGLEATLELPLGFLVRGHVGFLPEAYVRLVNAGLRDVGAYDEAVATLVDQSGANALVTRISGGIRPVPGYGFEILAGYTRIDASARVTAADFERATGQSMEWTGIRTVGIEAELHMVHVEIGWTAHLWEHLVVRGTLGWTHTLDVSHALDLPQIARRREPELIAGIEESVRENILRWGFTPELRLVVGYRF
jgi:hypothetical protein